MNEKQQLYKQRFGRKIRNLRVELGKSQQEISKDTGIHYSTISEYESGYKLASTQNLITLSLYFKVPIDQLLGGVVFQNIMDDRLVELLIDLDERCARNYVDAIKDRLKEEIHKINRDMMYVYSKEEGKQLDSIANSALTIKEKVRGILQDINKEKGQGNSRNKTTIFGERIKYLREDRGLSRQDLADSLNIAESTIRSYENGYAVPSFAVLNSIIKYFETTPNIILGYTDEEGQNNSKEDEITERIEKYVLLEIANIEYELQQKYNSEKSALQKKLKPF